MKKKIKADAKGSFKSMKNGFRQGISSHSAILLSLLLHFVIAAAAATFWVNVAYVKPPPSEATIEFDLASDPSTSKTRNENLAKASPQNNTTSPKAGEAGGESTIGNSSKKALVMASLADLSRLKTSFGFVQQGVAATDSSAGLTPMQGGDLAIDINSLAQEYENGRGKGGVTLSIGGACISGSNN